MKINILWEPDFVDEVQAHYFPYQFFLLVNKSSLLSCMNLLGSFNRLCKNNASFDYIIFLNSCECGIWLCCWGEGCWGMEDLLNISVLSAHPLCVKADEAMPVNPGSLPSKSLSVCWDKNGSYLCLISNFSCGRRLDYSKRTWSL